MNSLLVNDGLVPVPDALHLSEFDGLSAEEIYPMIEDELDRSTHDGHLYDGQATDENSVAPDSRACGDRPDTPSPLSPMERTKLEQQWQERLAGAAQQALQAGRLSASLARMLNLLITPSVPWRNTLAKFMSMRSRDDFDYARPGRREGDAILPALRSAGIEVVVALDTSGSIAVSEITEFVSEINALKGQVRARIALLACDSEIAPESPEIYEPWEAMAIPSSLGGGGDYSRPILRTTVEILNSEEDENVPNGANNIAATINRAVKVTAVTAERPFLVRVKVSNLSPTTDSGAVELRIEDDTASNNDAKTQNNISNNDINALLSHSGTIRVNGESMKILQEIPKNNGSREALFEMVALAPGVKKLPQLTVRELNGRILLSPAAREVFVLAP